MICRVLISSMLLCGMVLAPIGVAWAGKVKFAPLITPEPQSVAWFGWSIESVGDLNGDSFVDFAVGAPQQRKNDLAQGAVMIFSGRDGAFLFTVHDPIPERSAEFGVAISSTGDVNGDGISDLVVGARFKDVGGRKDQGEAYVFSGVDGTWLAVTLAALVPQESALFGASLGSGSLVDPNQDASSEVIVGAPQQSFGDLESAGAAFLMSATTGETLDMILPPNPQADASFGFAVESLGDIDGDSVVDFVVAAPFQNVSGNVTQGQVYAFSGQDGELLYTLNPPEPMPTGRFGFAMTRIADLNGDGVSDLVVSAPTYDIPVRNQGRTFVFSGANGLLLHTLDDPTPLENGLFGGSLASPGDIDGDGVADIAVGSPAPVSDSKGVIHPGEVVLFSGASGEHLLTLEDPSPESGAAFGFSLSAVGDVDGDGISDLLAGAPFHNVVVDGKTNHAQGEAFVISGLAPDLKGKILEVVRTVDVSGRDRLEFMVQVKNRGTVKTPVPFKVKAHLSSDGAFDGGKVDPKVAKWKMNESLLPGESITFTGSVEFEGSVSGMFLIIRVDVKNDIVERKEKNNVKSRQIP